MVTTGTEMTAETLTRVRDSPTIGRNMAAKDKGSAKAGASNAYLRLLSGKITSKQYTDQVKRSARTGVFVTKRAS